MAWYTRNLGDALAPGVTETAALEAADRAKSIAIKRGLPDTQIQTAEASAIGAVCARQYTGLGA